MASALLLSGCLSQLPAPFGDASRGSTAPSTAGAQADGQHHVVRQGDTLLGISRTYGQSVGDLVRWNGLESPHQIRVGQRLRVAPPSAGSGEDAVTVRPIESPGVVAEPSQPAAEVPLIDSPRGGRTEYSDEAWAAINPQILPSEPPLPIPSPPDTPPAQPAPAEPSEPAEKPAPAAPAAVEAPWLWPAAGEVIEGFDESSNKGLDIAGEPGDPVVAAAAGSVVYSGSGLRGYGKLVIIKHEDDFLTAYAHNRDLLVKEGDKVSKGQKIAELGSTDADRPKLHFEIRKQGKPVDPAKFLPAR
ncbi:peptidase [Pseudazoarcus pumilus]|uniref:Peptidase n=1 Tax=Pseudazoarcus pumilus TaxID=2067960 RepID=A0A2I6SB21_9RHOO|nr:peptidase [Pseudazoarcus pumilus]